jgi:hypothetical protein
VGIEDLELPGGVRVEKPDPTAQQLGNLLIQLLHGDGGLMQMLQSISNQLDLLIRLEVGQKPKSEVKTMINIFDTKLRDEAAALAAANGQAADAATSEAVTNVEPDTTTP